MDIAVFYEVQERLYNAALAGSGILSEDFRFRRAVEGLGLLAEKGKVFAAFKQKCENLLNAGEDTESGLADCIALADAIAVTLGRTDIEEPNTEDEKNRDSGDMAEAEKKESAGCGIWQRECPTKNIPVSVMTQVLECLGKGSEKVLEIPDLYPEVLADIRFCNKVAAALNGRASVPIEQLASILLDICGEDIAGIFKNSVDLTCATAKGRQVALIAYRFGADENAWYLELAQNENAPSKVRIEAITALSGSKENEAVLMELYRTEKGKVKNAAIESLVKINADGIQPYLKKLCEKEDLTEAEERLIDLSPSLICEEYAKNRVQWGIKDPEKYKSINVLDHKTGIIAEEAHLLLGKYNVAESGRNYGSQITLIVDLFEGYERTNSLLNRLYAREPELYAEAYVYYRLLQGDLEPADLKKVKFRFGYDYREDEKCPPVYRFVSDTVRRIRAIPVIKQYRLEWEDELSSFRQIGDHFPEVLLQVLTEDEALKNFHAAAECCLTLTKLCLKARPGTGRVISDYDHGIYGVGDWDRELVESYAIPFLKKAIAMYPSVFYGAGIHRLLTEEMDREDLYYEFVRKNLELQNQDKTAKPGLGWNASYYVEDGVDQQMIKEYEYAKKKISSWTMMISKEEKQRILSVIDRALGSK